VVRRMGKLLTWSVFLVILASILVILPWRWLAPPTTAFILRDSITRESPVHYQWVPWLEISPQLAIAAVAAEDQKFPTHHGFDLDSIAEALESNRQGRGFRGASTITQQVAKNLFLWQGQSLIRKAVEAYLTIWIELLWPKRRILEVYLNIAEFGPGVFGADAAAEHLLGKEVSALTLQEAATLVAVLPNPKRFSAARPSEYVLGRAEQIEYLVGSLGGTSYLRGL
jgi:monofunctional biosynthetic peptidoglycan transglycosylase